MRRGKMGIWAAPLLAAGLMLGGCAARNDTIAENRNENRPESRRETNLPAEAPDASANTRVEQAEDRIENAVEKVAGSVQELGGNALTTAKVKNALIADKTVPAMEIDVDTEKDRVTLSGQVDTAAQKKKAEQIAKKIEGVKKVVNKLTVAGQQRSQ